MARPLKENRSKVYSDSKCLRAERGQAGTYGGLFVFNPLSFIPDDQGLLQFVEAGGRGSWLLSFKVVPYGERPEEITSLKCSGETLDRKLVWTPHKYSALKIVIGTESNPPTGPNDSRGYVHFPDNTPHNRRF